MKLQNHISKIVKASIPIFIAINEEALEMLLDFKIKILQTFVLWTLNN